MNPYAHNAFTSLVGIVFGLYIMLLMVRILLQAFQANYFNPLSQAVAKITQPAIIPLRRFVPDFGRVNGSALAMMLIIQIAELWIVYEAGGHTPALHGVIVLAVAELLHVCINVFFWATLIRAIMSWVNPGSRHPAVDLLRSLSEPLLEPARRLAPATSGIDFSPILVIIGLQLVAWLLLDPLRDFGRLLLL